MKTFFAFLLFLSAILSGCATRGDASPITRTGFALDTVVSITIYDSAKSAVLDRCLEMCSEYENLFSATLEGSDVWKINHSGGNKTAVSYDTAQLIYDALYYCEKSGGVLDLTMRPIAEEWDIKKQMELDTHYIPSTETLSKLLEHVNYKNVIVTDDKGNTISPNFETGKNGLDRNAKYYITLADRKSAIDLGFIAKGFIADRLKEYLLSEGIQSGIISLGGNILLVGSKPDGSDFTVGIQKPFGAPNETITTLKKNDTSVVSSGCYERYFTDEKNGTIYHHIFDTATGCPVQNDLLGVTIISDSSLEGDALSTYCYILGLEKGLELIRGLEGVDAVFVTKGGEVVE